MPTYDYECKKCDMIFEVFQSISAPKLKICSKCNGPVKRLLGTGAGIVFKGTGFYETDYKNKKVVTSSSKKESVKPAAMPVSSSSKSDNKK